MLNEENIFVPFVTSDLPAGPWLVFAPHADDETFGMGGTLIKATAGGLVAHLVVLTDGALGGEEENLKAVREAEVTKVALSLGIASLDCWRERDRSLVPNKFLLAKTIKKIKEISPAAVFFPGPMELHPDHRNTALLVWSALQSMVVDERPMAYSYEISVQNPVNMLLDITEQYQDKVVAMGMYASQNNQNNYQDLVRALDKGRTFSLSAEVHYAEGFYRYSDRQLENSLASTLMQITSRYLSQDNCTEF